MINEHKMVTSKRMEKRTLQPEKSMKLIIENHLFNFNKQQYDFRVFMGTSAPNYLFWRYHEHVKKVSSTEIFQWKAFLEKTFLATWFEGLKCTKKRNNESHEKRLDRMFKSFKRFYIAESILGNKNGRKHYFDGSLFKLKPSSAERFNDSSFDAKTSYNIMP